MRRQVGADHVDIDTLEGTAKYIWVSPHEIDFELVDDAVFDAGYTLVGLEMVLRGEVVQADCSECGDVSTFLVVAETGQRFELAGGPPPGRDQLLKVHVTRWDADHLRLELLEVLEEGHTD